MGCLIATTGLVAWIITFQLNWRSWGATGTSMLLFVPTPELLGWGDETWAAAQAAEGINAVPPGGPSL